MESRQRTKIKMLFKRLLGMENEAERRELDAWLEEHPRDRRWVESMDGGREYLRRLEFLRRLNTEKELRGTMRGTSGRRVRWGWWAAAAVLLAWRVLHAPLGPKPMSLPQLRLMAAAVGAAACSAGGYLVNSRFLALSHHFSDQSQREWTTLDLGRLLNAWSDFLCLFGFPGDDQAIELTGTVSLFSIEGILGALGLLLAAALVAAMAHLVIRRRLLCFEHSALVCTLAACLAVDGAIFAFTNDMVGINGSYWLPVLPELTAG